MWTVCAEDGRTGWFPSNYVEDIPLEQQASQAQADKEIPGTHRLLHGIVVFDYSILCFINCSLRTVQILYMIEQSWCKNFFMLSLP
jgi:hypothetical protein